MKVEKLNLLSIIWDVDPVLLHLGPLEIRWYGMLWAVGLYLALLIEQRLYRQGGYPDAWTDSLFLWLTVGTIVGARLGHCLFYEWHQYGEPIQIFGWNITYRNPYIEHPFALLKVWEGGLASHGGAIGLIVASCLVYRRQFDTTLKLGSTYNGLVWIMDRLCIAVCIVGALIRLGNLFNSEIYGGPTDLPWAFVFVRDGQSVGCHPTQLYEALYCLIGYGVTMLMWRAKLYERRGLIFGVFLEIIFFTRFLLEFIKNNQESFEANFALNMGQVLSIPFILWGFYLIYSALRHRSH